MVVYFNWHQDKLFGKVRMLDDNGQPTGPQIHFHHSGGRHIAKGRKGPKFVNHFSTNGQPDRLRNPRRGDQIVFVPAPNHKGHPTAKLWGFAETWDKILHEFDGVA
jgi:hypothetical protein